jgi:hypothetical protein
MIALPAISAASIWRSSSSGANTPGAYSILLQYAPSRMSWNVSSAAGVAAASRPHDSRTGVRTLIPSSVEPRGWTRSLRQSSVSGISARRSRSATTQLASPGHCLQDELRQLISGLDQQHTLTAPV